MDTKNSEISDSSVSEDTSSEENQLLTPTESDDEEAEEIHSANKTECLAMERIGQVQRTGALKNSHYYGMMQLMQQYKDDATNSKGYQKLADFTAFHIAQAFKTNQNDLGLVLLMHQSENAYCLNDSKEAVRLAKRLPLHFKEADIVNEPFILGRIACYTACAYVGKKKLGKAWVYLQKAQYHLQNVERGDDLGILHFCLGRFFREFVLQQSSPSECLRQLAIYHYEQSSLNYSCDVQKGGHFEHEVINPYVYMARVCLDAPDSSKGRSRFIVTKEDITQAKKYLDHAKQLCRGLEHRSRCMARLILCEGSLYFRNYQMAEYQNDESDAVLNYAETMKAIQMVCDLLRGTKYIEEERAKTFLDYLSQHSFYQKHFASCQDCKPRGRSEESTTSTTGED